MMQYYDYPLEQGLRLFIRVVGDRRLNRYYDYPLEQGLRQLINNRNTPEGACIMIIH